MPIDFNRPIFLILCLLAPIIWIMMNRMAAASGLSRRKAVIGGIRILLIFLLGIALSEPFLTKHSDRVNLFFCLDVSDSVGKETKKTAVSVMERITSTMGTEDRAGLILFGKNPALEFSLKSNFHIRSITSDINTNYTNIHDALQFALGKLPQEGKNRIVLFSDGNENLKESVHMAYLAASLGVEIYPVPLASWFGKNEVYIQTLDTPPLVSLERPFEIQIIVVSAQSKPGELILYRNDTLLADESILLKPGKNVFSFVDRISESGLYLYRAVGNFAQDVFYQNNEGLSFTRGTRKARILYVTGDTGNSQPLSKILNIQGLSLVHRPVSELPGSLHALLDYNAIVLDNVSADAIPYTTLENIEKYVKETGGGLVMIGGDRSFGAGGYHKTPVEKALPVFMDAPTDLKFSALSLVFVIDKSSSMSASYKNKSKLEMAKIAAFTSIEMLNPTDQVAIIAFDTESKLIVPLTRASDRQQIANKLTMLKEGGGTDLYPALKDAFEILKHSRSTKKHIIVLSDGLTEEADFKTLLHAISRYRISVSTVSIGSNSDVELMESIAAWGEGRSYYTDDPDTIPNIFTGETKIIAKNLISEKTMKPVAVRVDEILQGLDETRLPVVYGQIITYPKPGASVLIKTELGPLLAAWRYGLGRSVAFTSDLNGRWGKQWVRWNHYGKFASQIVKWVQRKESQNQFLGKINRKGENATITVDVTDSQSRFINHLELGVQVLFPSKKSRTLILEQVAPGRYQAKFPAEETGGYYLSLYGKENHGFKHHQVFGFALPYTDEFSATGINYALLEQLASISGGRVLSLENIPNTLFDAPQGTRKEAASMWHVIAMLFLFFLIVDVAARKFISITDK
ncbi:MAG: VWA domain-containing protein [Deltaproteobacteria bacterium]|nr:VWA domain-containing protein [Deltaproteobacteria bacterium]